MARPTTHEGHDCKYLKAVYVFEAPVRLWHWLHTFSFLTLALTGYFIANPLPTLSGEASAHFLMGNIRLTHFIAAWVFTIGFLIRIYWAIVGNCFARQLFILPIWDRKWWRELWYEIRFYEFLTREQHKTLGHNPLAQSAMFLFNTLGTIFMIGTGFALYSQGLGDGSWADRLFGWVIPLMGGGEAVHNWHNLGMWLMLVFVIIHVYMAVRADIISRESSVSTIIGGWRMFKDDCP
ncbi:MAG TPA: Ni/Fe-hydrogenase, b-type cytochrome subunit [Sedimenticola sp.]|nr:Ni/Fe-hydrogenase, b-type cytochrome subunit [Sedimenticola sp.]